MTTEDFGHDAAVLVENVRDLLRSPNARDRVRAVRLLAFGINNLEHRVLVDAQSAGMTWEQIGRVYGVSRQAVHRRFADESVLSSEGFERLLIELDGDHDSPNRALRHAAKRERHASA